MPIFDNLQQLIAAIPILNKTLPIDNSYVIGGRWSRQLSCPLGVLATRKIRDPLLRDAATVARYLDDALNTRADPLRLAQVRLVGAYLDSLVELLSRVIRLKDRLPHEFTILPLDVQTSYSDFAKATDCEMSLVCYFVDTAMACFERYGKTFLKPLPLRDQQHLLQSYPALLAAYPVLFRDPELLAEAEARWPGLHQQVSTLNTLYDTPLERRLALQHWLGSPTRSSASTPLPPTINLI